MGGSQSRSSSRNGSGHGRYGHSRSLQQPPAQQWGAGPYPYGQDPQGGYYAPPQQGGYAAPAWAGGASKPRLDRLYPAYQPAPAWAGGVSSTGAVCDFRTRKPKLRSISPRLASSPSGRLEAWAGGVSSTGAVRDFRTRKPKLRSI